MKRLGLLLFLGLAVALLAGNALAQGDNSVYFTNYYSYANTTGAPDSTLRAINDGDTEANLWADIYIFDDSQELQTCCGCKITPDGLLSESVNTQLTKYPLTGRIPTRGVLKIISSSTGPDANGFPVVATPTAGIRAWQTHVQKLTTGYAVTETAYADSNLAASEQALLQNLCYYSELLSGTACPCTPEDHDF